MVVQQETYQKLPLESWEVGGELLDILSRGIYSDAKDAVREYVQNAVDAAATSVLVTVSGPRATIRDDGSGMDWETLRGARRFGISDKNPRFNVGYRGIGMYAAFGMCETMRVSTRQAGTNKLLHLILRFGEMRRILEEDRTSEVRVGVGLADLLFEYTEFGAEEYPIEALGDHFTLVTLEGITQEYRAQLNDPEALDGYLLNALPVAFPDEGYGNTVNEWLREHLGLNPVRLVVRVGDEPEFNVQPRLAEYVEAPQNHWIRDSENRKIAFIWHALSTRGQRIPSPPGTDEGSGVSGYLLKIKGFTLGDRSRLKPLWPAVGGRTLYHHYTGEVHVLEAAEVYPNAARDDLESSPNKQLFRKHLEDYFNDMNRRADLTRDILRTRRRMQGVPETLESLGIRSTELDQNPFELYRDSKNFLDELEKVERDLLRLRRGRRAVQPTPAQSKQLEELRDDLRKAKGIISGIVRATSRRTENAQQTSTGAAPEVPPRAALITRATNAMQAMVKDSQNVELNRAFIRLRRAGSVRSVAQAVEVLDSLKASGEALSEAVEAARKELRTHLGRSPGAPVSLEEALAESGFLAATEREALLIQAIDQGILNGLDSRGERYEAVLRAISESVSENDGLQ